MTAAERRATNIVRTANVQEAFAQLTPLSKRTYIVEHLAKLTEEADARNDYYWEVKDELDAFIQFVLTLPLNERPPGDEIAEVVGLDRRRLYQIGKLTSPSPRRSLRKRT